MVRNDLGGVIPESVAHKALRLPAEEPKSIMRESDIVPSLPATSIVQEKVKKVLTLRIDPESPESFMLRPKRRRWENEKYTRWVKAQPCACCGMQADDPHHLIGHGQGGMGTKAHDLWVLPLCRKHHDELHADIYAARSGLEMATVQKLMDAESYIGGSDAVEKGLADSLLSADAVSDGDESPAAALRKLDALLAKTNTPRSERRKLIKALSGGMPGAVTNHDGTPCAADDIKPETINSLENALAALVK